MILRELSDSHGAHREQGGRPLNLRDFGEVKGQLTTLRGVIFR